MEQINKGEVPFVRILLPLMAGIGATCLFMPSIGMLKIVTCLTAICTLLLTFRVVLYRRFYKYHSRWIPGVLFHIIIFLTGYELSAYKSQQNKDHFSRSGCEMLIVSISSEPKLSGGILRFESDVKQGYKKSHFTFLTGKLLLTLITDPSQHFEYGDLLLIPASFNEAEPPLNPNEFNYKAYLADHGIYHQTFLNAGQVRLLRRNSGNPFVSYAFKLREKLVHKFNKYIPGPDAASVASTLILGYRADLSREILDAYAKTGTMHVLSVSGMHVSIVFIVMLFLLKFLDRSRKLQLIRAALIITLIWFYAIITGFSPAACRAALMLSFVIIGKAIRRGQNTYNLLAISAVLLLICNPLFLFDVGFQLSYIAVLGLVYLYPRIYQLFFIQNRFCDKVWGYLSLSMAAQLATFPLTIYYFHQFPVYFLLSNLFIILPVTIIMYTGLLFLFIPWDILLKPLGWLLDKSIAFTNNGLLHIENLPFANISAIWINAWVYLLIYVLILSTVFALIYRVRKLIYVALLTVFLLAASNSFQTVNLYNNNQIIFYSLRKNTGIGFFEGRQAIIVTDLKAGERTFTYAIQPSVEANGIRKEQVLKPGASFSERGFYSDSNFIQFRNWKMLIWNKNFDKKIFSKPVSVDAVLLQGNPAITLKFLREAVNFKKLFIDASNMDYRIGKWKDQASEIGIDCYVLKKNAAYVVKL